MLGQILICFAPELYLPAIMLNAYDVPGILCTVLGTLYKLSPKDSVKQVFLLPQDRLGSKELGPSTVYQQTFPNCMNDIAVNILFTFKYQNPPWLKFFLTQHLLILT